MSQQDNLFIMNFFDLFSTNPMYRIFEHSWRVFNGHKKIRIVTENDKDVKQALEESTFIKRAKNLYKEDSYTLKLLYALYIRHWLCFTYGGWQVEPDMMLLDVLPRVDENFSYVNFQRGKPIVGTCVPVFFKKDSKFLKANLEKLNDPKFDITKGLKLLDNANIENNFYNEIKNISEVEIKYLHCPGISGSHISDENIFIWNNPFKKIFFCLDDIDHSNLKDTVILSLKKEEDTSIRHDCKYHLNQCFYSLNDLILYYKFLAWKIKNVFNKNIEDYIEIEDELLKMAEDSPIKFDLDFNLSEIYKLFNTY